MNTYVPNADKLTTELQAAVSDLRRVNPWKGLFRFVTIGIIVLSLMTLAWLTSNILGFMLITCVAGIFYAFWMICSHDMAHNTLTGNLWLERVLPRLTTWPMFWPSATYALLHRLHHGWNGIDLRDPERVQWSNEEYQRANQLQRWYLNHQWILDIFVLGGIGLIIKTFANGWQFRNILPQLRSQIWVDVIGIIIMQGGLLAFFYQRGEINRYLLLWLILERTVGSIIQVRDHVEHYGLWGQIGNHQLTQLYACRNLATYPWLSWLMGGLNYHAVHHAFPDIPFDQLPTAFQRIQEVLQRHDLPPMIQEKGYLQEVIKLSQQPSTIGNINSQDIRGRRYLLPI
jgi:fatty acid desaturase